MGAVKSVPVLGEVVTVAEFTAKMAAVGATAPFSTKVANNLCKSAENGVKDYAERSILVNATVTVLEVVTGQDDEDEIKERWKKVGSSCGELVDGLPVVGHVKGIVHYAKGDREKGDHCMKAASRSTVMAGATVLTGGMGAAWTAAAAVTSGLAMDETTTIIDSVVHKEWRPSGHLAAITNCVESDNKAGAIADAILGASLEIGMVYATAKLSEPTTTEVYRVMDQADASNAVKQQTMPQGFKSGTGPLGETWVSESIEHSKTYMPKQQAQIDPTSGVKLRTVEFQLDKGFMKDMKNNQCIPQKGANAINKSGGPIKNVINNEHLTNHPTGKVNIGVKNSNLPEFNQNISKVKTVDPMSWRYKNGFTKAVSKYGIEEFTENSACRRYGQTTTEQFGRKKEMD